MEYTSEVRKLSNLFYNSYPHKQYPELEQKENRCYSTLLIDRHDGYFICIPFRSNITHEDAYLFKNSLRSQTNRSGLDYTKIVIIEKSEYIDDAPGVVDTDEYKEMRDNIDDIVAKACLYVDTYIAHVKGTAPLSKRNYRKHYWYTTLKYFHKEMNI